jgi:hypothetical protein
MTFFNIQQPAPHYDVAKERERNRRIEELLAGKLDRAEITTFGGIPTAIHEGTDAAFSCPAAANTVLPLNTLLKSGKDFTAGSDILPPYGGWLRISYKLRHVTVGGTNPYVVTVSIYEGATLMDASKHLVELTTLADSFGTIDCFSLGGAITLKVAHTAAAAVLIDLTNSWLSVMLLDAHPKLNENERGA